VLIFEVLLPLILLAIGFLEIHDIRRQLAGLDKQARETNR
jgi:hypothetical protein